MFAKTAESALNTDAKKLVVVAFVMDAFDAKRFVAVAEVTVADTAVKLLIVDEPALRDDTEIFPAVTFVSVVEPSVDDPFANKF